MQSSACVGLVEMGSLELRRNHPQWVWAQSVQHKKRFIVSDFR